MNHEAIKHLSGIDRHRFERAHNKKASELTLDDCMVLARCGQALRDDPYLESWTYGGESFDLNVWADYDADDEEGTQTPEHVTLTVFNVDSEGNTDYSETVQEWTIDYNQTETWR